MTSLLLVIKKDWRTKSNHWIVPLFQINRLTSSPRIIQLQFSDFLKCSSRQTSKCSRSHITYNEILMKWNSIDNSIDIPNIQYLPFKSNWVLIKTISLRPRKTKRKLQNENCKIKTVITRYLYITDLPLLYSHSNTFFSLPISTQIHININLVWGIFLVYPLTTGILCQSKSQQY